jgi:uncharacterized BrkB/YihY/UPF0761 family membrane protein
MLSLENTHQKIHRVRASIPAHRKSSTFIFWIIAYLFVQTLKVPLGVLIGIILMPPVSWSSRLKV